MTNLMKGCVSGPSGEVGVETRTSGGRRRDGKEAVVGGMKEQKRAEGLHEERQWVGRWVGGWGVEVVKRVQVPSVK